MALKQTYRHNVMVVQHYTSGRGHPSAAHVVGGFKYRIIRTSAVVLSQLGVATFYSFCSENLSSIDVDESEMRGLVIARGVGRMLSSIGFGLLLDRWQHHHCLFGAAALALAALASVLTALSQNLMMFMAGFFLLGIGIGSVEICNIYVLLKLWNKSSSTPLHALFACTSLGSLFGFLFQSKVISEAPQGGNWTTDGSYTLLPSTLNSSSKNMESTFKIEMLSLGVMFYCLIFLTLISLIYCYERFKIHSFSGEIIHHITPNSLKQATCSSTLSPASCTGGRPMYGLIFSLFMFLFFFNVTGSIQSSEKFFSYSPCVHPNYDIAKLVWMYGIFGCRVISILYSYFLLPHYTIFAQLSAQFICALFLTLCEESHPITQYAMLGVIAFSLAGMTPAFLAWGNMYIEMKGLSLSVAILGGSFGTITFYWIGCELLEKNSALLSSLGLGSSVFSILVFVMVYLVSVKQGQRADAVSECEHNSYEDAEEEMTSLHSNKKVTFNK